MKRPDLSLALGLFLSAAALSLSPAEAGEIGPPLQPGLEIFDGAAPAPMPPAPLPNEASGQAEVRQQLRNEAAKDDFMADPFLMPSPTPQPHYQPPDMGIPSNVSRPYQAPRSKKNEPEPEPYIDPYLLQSGEYMPPDADPFANLEPAAPPAPPQGYQDYVDPDSPAGGMGMDPYADPYAAPPYMVTAPTYDAQPPAPSPSASGGMTADPFAFRGPVRSAAQNLNARNPNFPGLADAAAQGDLNMAGSVILDTLRQRRVVDATMARGIRGSLGVSSPYEMHRLLNAVNQTPQGLEDPLAAAQRINVILDSFQQPMLDDPGYIDLMPRILDRLNHDIAFVRNSLYENVDDGTFLELSRTYVRSATTCDFFAFPRRSLANDVKMIVNRSGGMFNPDGSSRAGDTGGITGNLFQVMFMMEFYTRDDSWFRRDISGLWKQLEKPARHLLNIACPDMSLPQFGPRSSRELLPVEIEQLRNTFPAQPPRFTRLGLAASESYPPTSGAETFGGIYVMRDAKKPDGRYLAVRFGAPSSLPSVPSHEDFGSISLMTRGGKYVVDAGGYGGVAASGPAHGGMSLNEKYATLNSYNLPDLPADAIWRTNASIDYASDQAGYEDGKTWQRSVLYVKTLPGETMTDYWMVLDHVNLQGDPTPQMARVRYQLAPGVHLYREGPGVTATTTMAGTGLRIFAVDAGARLDILDGTWGAVGGQVFDAAGGSIAAPSVAISRQLTGDSTTTTLFYPMDNPNHRPVRIERDSDIIRGRTGAIVVDHGLDRIDVIAWAPPGTELVTPTLNLQLSADLAVFRVRRGKIARIDFINLERFQAKEPDGGLWSMRVHGTAQSLTIEPERGGGWQVISDPANTGTATLFDVNFGPILTRQKFSIRPGELRVLTR